MAPTDTRFFLILGTYLTDLSFIDPSSVFTVAELVSQTA